ncbi:hypothetical protein [Acetobacter sp.]|jgi:hypothetical protein|uniref:hypothetical protein n=1 Tax=Acetobacter sp. TaxID=440 RepID=UPI0025C5243F|nr:hypothetical protein [Acetobacter sp.]MCH4090077.1 hypothetical protein [Acetobacter sp.]MCI1298773.1 hypothetical protein [Acetobacter sp.]MCI1314792.1 hypothetical protein [Acetobacter sp.]
MSTFWLPLHVFSAIMVAGLSFGGFFQLALALADQSENRQEGGVFQAILFAGLVLTVPFFGILIFSGIHLVGLFHIPPDVPWISSALRSGLLALISLCLGMTCLLFRPSGSPPFRSLMIAAGFYAMATLGFGAAIWRMLGKGG